MASSATDPQRVPRPSLAVADARLILDRPAGVVWASDHYVLLADLQPPPRTPQAAGRDRCPGRHPDQQYSQSCKRFVQHAGRSGITDDLEGVMRIGNLTVDPISDGVFVARPSYFGRGVRPDARPEVFDRHRTAWLPIGCFLIRSASRVVLVDCGLGPQAKPLPDGMRLAGGRLLTELRAAGCRPGEVTDVVCTHLHSDHVGWLFDRNGEQVFAAAAIWFGAADWNHFVTGPGEIDQHIRRGFRTMARRRLRPIQADTELAPGVAAVLTPGHTPGHLCVQLTSAGRCAWLVGDAITCPIQLLEPSWHSFGDVDPALAQRSRDYLWGELRRPHTIGTGAHFPGLQFGHVRRDPHPRWMETVCDHG